MLQFAPDADPSQPGVIYAASNIRPTARGYATYGWPEKADSTNILYSDDGVVLNTPVIMYGHEFSTAGSRIIIGGYSSTTGKLHQLKPTGGTGFTLTDAYTTHWTIPAGGTKWTFTSFGEYVIAASPDTGTQFVQTAINNQFTAVSGSPACRSLCTFKNFVIAGNCQTYGSVTGTPDMVAWSALGDHTSWVPSIATQAGYQQIYDPPGAILYVKPIGDAVAIYKASGIVLMRATGNPNLPFSFQRAAGGKGALGNVGGLVDIGDRHIYIGQDDIYIFDGATSRSITYGRVHDYLVTNFVPVTAVLTPSQIQHDAFTGEVLFLAYGLTYNYRLDKWGTYSYTVGQSAPAAQSAVCHVVVPALAAINRAQGLTIGSDGHFYNRLTPILGSPRRYSSMALSVLRGANDNASVVRRVAPRFVSPPMSGTLAYSTRVHMGSTASSVGSYTLTADNFRFNLAQAAQWHDMTMTLVSVVPGVGTSPIDLVAIEYDLAPAGGATESRYIQ
jgi:hypothetical protein